MASLHVGISGYAYKEWKGDGLFYPPTLKNDDFLKYYASRYNGLESEQTFYRAPSDATVAKWLEAFPEGFKVSPKLLQGVTHYARLKPSSVELVEEFVRTLGPIEKAGKLGPILIQLPPNLKRDDELLAYFLNAIPKRDSLTWAVEFRNDSWHTQEVEEILRHNGVAWAAVETDEAEAQVRDTAPHVYVRLRKLAYTDEELQRWSAFFNSAVSGGKDCFVYCRHKDVPEPWVWADRLIELG